MLVELSNILLGVRPCLCAGPGAYMDSDFVPVLAIDQDSLTEGVVLLVRPTPVMASIPCFLRFRNVLRLTLFGLGVFQNVSIFLAEVILLRLTLHF